ncbi:avidin-like [Athene cunicularia]|uniref:avidin-like n=1 Tax=Athene cunicularia TaxID=194338 RepID=UPI000EF6EADB|nr:avidin-like [Athene cunicularia]
MVRVTPFLLVLSLALVAQGLSDRKCVLTGQWKNDLGSNMTIGELQGNGAFSGTYLMAISMSLKKILGSQQHTNQPTFGFTVNWTFTRSTGPIKSLVVSLEMGQEVEPLFPKLSLDTQGTDRCVVEV